MNSNIQRVNDLIVNVVGPMLNLDESEVKTLTEQYQSDQRDYSLIEHDILIWAKTEKNKKINNLIDSQASSLSGIDQASINRVKDKYALDDRPYKEIEEEIIKLVVQAMRSIVRKMEITQRLHERMKKVAESKDEKVPVNEEKIDRIATFLAQADLEPTELSSIIDRIEDLDQIFSEISVDLKAQTHGWVGESTMLTKEMATVLTVLREHGVLGGKILDAGAGVGRNSLYLSSLGYDVTSLELDPVACATIAAMAKVEGINLPHIINDDVISFLSDLSRVPDGSLDAVLDSGMSHYLDAETKKLYFDLIQKKLKPGGVFAVLHFSEEIQDLGSDTGIQGIDLATMQNLTAGLIPVKNFNKISWKNEEAQGPDTYYGYQAIMVKPGGQLSIDKLMNLLMEHIGTREALVDEVAARLPDVRPEEVEAVKAKFRIDPLPVDQVSRAIHHELGVYAKRERQTLIMNAVDHEASILEYDQFKRQGVTLQIMGHSSSPESGVMKVMVNSLGNRLLGTGFLKSSAPATLDDNEIIVSQIGKALNVPVADVIPIWSRYGDYNVNGIVSIDVAKENEKMILMPEAIMAAIESGQLSEEELSLINQREASATLDNPDMIKQLIELQLKIISAQPGMTPENFEICRKAFLESTLFDYLVHQDDRTMLNSGLLRDTATGSYKMAPLFDNGLIEENHNTPEQTGAMALFNHSHTVDRDAFVQTMFTHYYPEISNLAGRITDDQELYQSTINLIVDKNTTAEHAALIKHQIGGNLDKVVALEKHQRGQALSTEIMTTLTTGDAKHQKDPAFEKESLVAKRDALMTTQALSGRDNQTLTTNVRDLHVAKPMQRKIDARTSTADDKGEIDVPLLFSILVVSVATIGLTWLGLAL